jgi:hypothetical protein
MNRRLPPDTVSRAAVPARPIPNIDNEVPRLSLLEKIVSTILVACLISLLLALFLVMLLLLLGVTEATSLVL